MAKRSSNITFGGIRPISHAAAPRPQLQATGQPLRAWNPATQPYPLNGVINIPGMPGRGGPASPFPGVAGWGG
jgi:hypothetical protein